MPIENNAVTCSQCHTDQTDTPKQFLQTESVPPRNNDGLLRNLFDLAFHAPEIALILLAAPLIIISVGGYLVAGQMGAAIGIILAVFFLFCLDYWDRSGG